MRLIVGEYSFVYTPCTVSEPFEFDCEDCAILGFAFAACCADVGLTRQQNRQADTGNRRDQHEPSARDEGEVEEDIVLSVRPDSESGHDRCCRPPFPTLGRHIPAVLANHQDALATRRCDRSVHAVMLAWAVARTRFCGTHGARRLAGHVRGAAAGALARARGQATQVSRPSAPTLPPTRRGLQGPAPCRGRTSGRARPASQLPRTRRRGPPPPPLPSPARSGRGSPRASYKADADVSSTSAQRPCVPQWLSPLASSLPSRAAHGALEATGGRGGAIGARVFRRRGCRPRA